MDLKSSSVEFFCVKIECIATLIPYLSKSFRVCFTFSTYRLFTPSIRFNVSGIRESSENCN